MAENLVTGLYGWEPGYCIIWLRIYLLHCMAENLVTALRGWEPGYCTAWLRTWLLHCMVETTKWEWADYTVQAQSGNTSGKPAHTQLTRECLSTVISAHWATVMWSLAWKTRWCVSASLHLKKKEKKKRCRQTMSWIFSIILAINFSL